MKARQPTELGRSLMGFFEDYLPALRGMSRNTIRTYRDGLVGCTAIGATALQPQPRLPQLYRCRPGSGHPQAVRCRRCARQYGPTTSNSRSSPQLCHRSADPLVSRGRGPLDRCLARTTLERNPESALQRFHSLGVLGDQEWGKRVNCREAPVAGSDTVVALGLETLQQLPDALGAQITDLQRFNPTGGIARDEVQQQESGRTPSRTAHWQARPPRAPSASSGPRTRSRHGP